jgi:AraC family transcriptional regulator of adaptative response/methylated-DNA-[protein]-cysteine methyltransferase
MENPVMTPRKIPASYVPKSKVATAQFRSDDERWSAVVHRDARADGWFYYSVRTTGVYCRPSCASRLARRENVAFHELTESAEAAGYRACKRCRPNEKPLAARRADAIARACKAIETAEDAPDFQAIAVSVGMSRFHFQRVFRAITGLTPKAYAVAHRAERVRHALSKNPTVTDAIYDSGFNSNGRFYATADHMLGMTPTAFRAGAPNEDIRFAVGQSSLGPILVAASKRGVCAILFGESPAALAEDLERRFPKARLISGDRSFESWVAKVVGFVETPGIALDLPLDVRGTVFERRVWKALQQIPIGSTASYSDVAHQIGAPSSARAVARACASNLLAVAIPCHRVVRIDGGLSGYRWGVSRKRALLESERAVVSS